MAESRTAGTSTRIAAYEHLGGLLFEQKRFDDAAQAYGAGFDLDDAPTAVRERFRAALAKSLSAQGHDDEVIALFERTDRPACPDPLADGQLALAYAYAAKGRYAEAQALIDVQRPRQAEKLVGSDDLSAWDKLGMTVACRQERRDRCVADWDRLLRWPFRNDALSDQLTAELPRLRGWPEAAAMLAQARMDGMVEQDAVAPHRFARMAPRPVRRVSPRYPVAAARSRIEGRLLLELLIGKDGRVGAIRVVKATPAGIFEKAALDAVKKWTFEPARVDDEPVESVGIQQVDFAMAR